MLHHTANKSKSDCALCGGLVIKGAMNWWEMRICHGIIVAYTNSVTKSIRIFGVQTWMSRTQNEIYIFSLFFFWVLLCYLHDFFNPKFRTIRSWIMPHYIPVFHCCFCEHLISKIKFLKILFLNFVKMMIRYTKIKDLFSDFNLWRIIWTEAFILSSH